MLNTLVEYSSLKKSLTEFANYIRYYSLDAIEKAKSGHIGLPLGCAELGAYLFGHYMRFNPHKPRWHNRDRFILSAGHGSILQYICLHIMGFDINRDELQKFRQARSKTPSHPQYRLTPGIETTTGLDGQGIGFAVGHALGLKILSEKFKATSSSFFDSKVIVLAGDGCLMEGISSESCSIAGNLQLNNLIIIYDSNQTCLDGFVDETFNENIQQRFESYGFKVFQIDGHDFNEIHNVLEPLRNFQDKPVLIIANTKIGKGLLGKEGLPTAHDSRITLEDVELYKKNNNILHDQLPNHLIEFIQNRVSKNVKLSSIWENHFNEFLSKNKNLKNEFDNSQQKFSVDWLLNIMMDIKEENPISGRKSSGLIINHLIEFIPHLIGGSADLARSDHTFLNNYSCITKNNFLGKNIKYGVREFGMGAIAIGLSQTDLMIPFCGTFLAFIDYMKSTFRMAAMMKSKDIYQLTHDSMWIGENGPTHQPVEQIAELRAIPGLRVIRPADFYETKMAWVSALTYDGPSAIILSRQDLPQFKETQIPYSEGFNKGAYILRKEKAGPDFTLFATGSEVSLALEVADALEKNGKHCRVVSFPCFELFDIQTEDYKQKIITDIGIKVSIEAGISQPWYKYISNQGIAISIEDYGESASEVYLKDKYGFTVDSILRKLHVH